MRKLLLFLFSKRTERNSKASLISIQFLLAHHPPPSLEDKSNFVLYFCFFTRRIIFFTLSLSYLVLNCKSVQLLKNNDNTKNIYQYKCLLKCRCLKMHVFHDILNTFLVTFVSDDKLEDLKVEKRKIVSVDFYI